MGKRAFISYARADAERVSGIERRLRQLDYTVWIDQVLKGGQAWWDEILQQIRECDVLIAIVSPASIDSRACLRERMYAEALGKPVLPVAIAPHSQALPSELSRRQLVDYTVPNEDAAFRLAAALYNLPPAPVLEGPLPDPPEIPLSYLAALVDAASSPETLSKSAQVEMLGQLEAGLRAADSDEREGAWHVLQLLEDRSDLYADTQRRIDQIRVTYRSRVADVGARDAQTEGTAIPPDRTHDGGAPAALPMQAEPTVLQAPPPPPERRTEPPAPPPPQYRPVPVSPPATPPSVPRLPVDRPMPAGQAAVAPPGQPYGPPPPNYLAWAIVTTVLCCLPLGIVSIVYANQVNSKWALGDAAGAHAAAQQARTFAIWAAVTGVVLIGGYLIVSVFASPTFY